jgi:lipopolysaccharide export system permease protein
MQFFWLYMDELIGKGLGVWMILQLLVLMSATLVPLALPLGILLAAIMTFGNMGENFELVAIKASGISLLRFMRPLLLFIIAISSLAFLFNNTVIPVANLKALSLLYDLRNSKPTLNLRAGQFNNEIDHYSIRIGEKDKDGHTIRDIMIYDQTAGLTNTNIVIAKQGVMIPSPDNQFLIFRLRDGWRYEQAQPGGGGHPYTQRRIHFGQWDKVFDLSGFKLNRTNEDLFKNAYQMMNISQLDDNIDSMKKSKTRRAGNVQVYLSAYISLLSTDNNGKMLKEKLAKKQGADTLRSYKTSFIEQVSEKQRAHILDLVSNNFRTTRSLLDISASDNKLQIENMLKYIVEWHRKFTLSFACILLFLIGAPLGAIIRKGGLGMPMVVAVGFFLLWYIISLTGEKLSKSGALPVIFGMWMSAVILMPLAIVLIQQARNDSQIFTKEWYLRAWNRIRMVFIRKEHALQKKTK